MKPPATPAEVQLQTTCAQIHVVLGDALAQASGHGESSDPMHQAAATLAATIVTLVEGTPVEKAATRQRVLTLLHRQHPR